MRGGLAPRRMFLGTDHEGHPMSAVSVRMARLLRRDEGASAIEYAMVAGLIAAVIVIAVSLVGSGVSELFTDASDKISSVESASP